VAVFCFYFGFSFFWWKTFPFCSTCRAILVPKKEFVIGSTFSREAETHPISLCFFSQLVKVVAYLQN